MKTLLKALGFFLIWLLSLAIAGAAQADYDASDDLMGVFGGSCDSFKGALPSLASAQAGALKNIIERMRNDRDCQGVAGALANLDGVNFAALEAEMDSAKDLDRLRDQGHDLELALQTEQAKPASEQDASYIALIKSSLSETRLALLKARSQPAHLQAKRSNLVYGDLQRYATQLFSALESAPKCSTRYPAVAGQFGGQLIAVASHLAGGFMAPLLLASGNVIERYFSFLRNRPLSREYRNLVDTRMSQAMGCALEGTAKTFCRARDLEKVVRANAANRQIVEPACREDWQGVNLIGQDLPAFSDWMTRLAAGSKAVSTSQSTEKKQARELLSLAEKMKDDIDGRLSAARSKLSRQAESEVILELVDQLSGVTGPYGNYNAITASLFREDRQCGAYVYFYTGGARRKCDLPANQRPESCLECLTQDTTPETRAPIADIEAAAARLLTQAREKANSEASLSIESNPMLVLAQAEQEGRNGRKAIDFLRGALSYLGVVAQKPEFGSGYRAELVKDLSRRVRCSLEIIDKKPRSPECLVRPSATPKPAGEETITAEVGPNQVNVQVGDEVTDLATLLSPQRDLFYVANSLYGIVLQDLDIRRRGGQVGDELSVILQLSSSDSLGELLNNFGGLDASNASAIQAQESTLRNLTSLAGTFGPALLKSLKEQKASGSRLIGLTCMQLLLVPDAPKIGREDISRECSGTQHESLLAGNVLKFDEWKSKPREQRACALYDFYRKSAIQERELGRHSTPQSSAASPGGR